MGTLAIVEVEIASNGTAGFTDALVSSQIHFLVFDASPQTLNKHVVSPSPLANHADRYPSVGKDTGERRAGELGAPGPDSSPASHTPPSQWPCRESPSPHRPTAPRASI